MHKKHRIKMKISLGALIHLSKRSYCSDTLDRRGYLAPTRSSRELHSSTKIAGANPRKSDRHN